MATLSFLNKRQRELTQELGRRHIMTHKAQDAVLKQAQAKLIEKAMRQIKLEAVGWYTRYAEARGIDPAIAKMQARTADIRYLSERARSYVERRHDLAYARSMTANEEMALYNLSMKMGRAEVLLRNMELVMRSLNDQLTEMTGDYVFSGTMYEMYYLANVLKPEAMTPMQIANAAREITNTPYFESSFADTHWKYNDKAMTVLQDGLSKSLLQGKNPRTWASALDQFIFPMTASLRSTSELIAINETAARQERLMQQAIHDAGFSYYIIIAEIDDRTCNVCIHFDGAVYPERERMEGMNAPKFHANCRCITMPFVQTDGTIAADIAMLEQYINVLEAATSIEEMKEHLYWYNPADYRKYFDQVIP